MWGHDEGDFVMRKYFTAAAVVSFVVLVALVGMWVRSYRTRTVYEFWRADGLWQVASEEGRMRIDNEPQRRLEDDNLEAHMGRFVARTRGPAMTALRVTQEQESDSPRRRESVARAKDQALVYIVTDRRLQQAAAKRLALKAAGVAAPIPRPLVSLALPCPLLVAAAAVLPLAWVGSAAVKRRRRNVRVKRGLCLGCGYDLRASGERCPECGVAASRLVTSAAL